MRQFRGGNIGCSGKVEGAAGVAHGHAQAATIERTVGSACEQLQRLDRDVVRHALDSTEFLHEFSGRCRVMHAIFQSTRCITQRLGYTSVALRTGGLGERLISGIAHRLAAEFPAPSVDFQ